MSYGECEALEGLAAQERMGDVDRHLFASADYSQLLPQAQKQ